MDGPEWEGISQQAKDFVSSLLEYKEKNRITAEKALESPWLKKHDDTEENLDDDIAHAVAEAMITASQEPKLKRLSMLIIAHEAAESKLDELREAFAAMDTTKDGTICGEEFQSIIENSPSLNLRKEEISALFDELDMNDAGIISYTDFLSSTLESMGNVDKGMIADAFEKLDIESTGFIDKENIESVLLADSKKDEASAQAEEILCEVDADHTGKIDFETFLTMFEDEEV